jgi:death-on-curing protein
MAARPTTAAFGQEAYPDRWSKVAAVLQSLVKTHPPIDGNKRLGWLATATFLEINGVAATSVANDDVYRFVMNVAAGRVEVDELAAELQRLTTPGPVPSS